MKRWSVGILVFDGVAALDVAGPFEVFSRARLEPGVESRHSEDEALFDVFTVAQDEGAGDRHRRAGAAAAPRRSPTPRRSTCCWCRAASAPGRCSRTPQTIEWIRRTAATARRTASVCTGALLLARAGLLDGRRATTHWGSFGLLASLGNDIRVDREARFVDDGVLTSAGLASGMDLAFHVVETLFGRAVADETARYIEYRRG